MEPEPQVRFRNWTDLYFVLGGQAMPLTRPNWREIDSVGDSMVNSTEDGKLMNRAKLTKALE